MSTKVTGDTVVLMVIMPPCDWPSPGSWCTGLGADLEHAGLILLLGSSGESTFRWVLVLPLMGSGDLEAGS